MSRATILASLLLAPALAACLAPAGGLDPAGEAPIPGGFSDVHVFPGDYDLGSPFSRVLEPGPFAILPAETTTLTSDLDGSAIQLGYVLPDVPAGTRVPILLWISPYLADLAQVPLGPAQDGDGGVAGGFLVENFVPHGYAVAAVAVRGSAGSGGCLEWLGSRERADVLQALDWLVAQPWTTGAVGTYGLSYEAGAQWALAASGHPAVKTIVPVNGPNDLWVAVARNGSVSTSVLLVEPATAGLYTVDDRDPRALPEAVCPEFAERRALLLASVATGEQGAAAPIFADRAFRSAIEERYRGSILLAQGFRDDLIFPRNSLPWVATLPEKGIVVKQLLGMGGHHVPDLPGGRTPRADWAEVLLHWYDYWLKGDRTVPLGPPVQVADTERGWRSEASWPPADAAPRVFYLASGSSLLDEPSPDSARLEVHPDPASSALPVGSTLRDLGAPPVGCPTCLVFFTETFERDFRFAGLPQVHLTVVPRGPGGHLTARLYAASEEGTRLLTQGGLDLRFAAGGDTPAPVAPGTPLVAALELEPIDARVPAGSRLLLSLSQGGHGNMYFYHGGWRPAPFEVEVGGETSLVRVLAFEREATDGRHFQPPGGPE